MGVEFLVCECCGDTFPDCGDYVSCGDGCYKRWCSDGCAESDGLKDDTFDEVAYREDHDIDEDEEIDIDDVDGEYIIKSCNYCRKEDHEDYELLDFALILLGLDRSGLVTKFNDHLKTKKVGE